MNNHENAKVIDERHDTDTICSHESDEVDADTIDEGPDTIDEHEGNKIVNNHENAKVIDERHDTDTIGSHEIDGKHEVYDDMKIEGKHVACDDMKNKGKHEAWDMTYEKQQKILNFTTMDDRNR